MDKGSFYRYADDAVFFRPDGSPDLLTVLPFEVMKLTKEHLVVRFEFGASEVFAYRLSEYKTAEAAPVSEPVTPRRGRPKRVPDQLAISTAVTSTMIDVGGSRISFASFEPWTGGFI